MKRTIAFTSISAFLLSGCLETGLEVESTEAEGAVSAEVSGSVEVSGSIQATASQTSAPSVQAMVQSIYGLGPCNASNEGSASYVIDESTYFQCSQSLWTPQKMAAGNTCTISGNGTGNIVFCGNVSIGTLILGGGTSLDSSIAAIVGKDGKDGVDGKDGRDGIDGKDGHDGIDGVDGKDGRDGIDGKDGKDGRDGIDGKDGKDGRDGIDGKDGINGIDGKDGRDGIDGKDGRDGIDGKDGKDGASCTAIPLLDNTGYKIVCGGDSVGVLLHGLNGRDGVDGKDGIDGKDGRDGVDGKDGKDCDCCDSSKITKKTWENLNPNVDYCQFQDARDGQWYRCVVIGNQTWMAENLNFANTVSESWCYGNKEENCDIYGRLYTWAAAANLPENYNNTTAGISSKHQGACPAGWHLPTNAEWNTLASYISQRNSLTGKALLSKTYGGTDEFGFSAMLVGNWKTDLIERSDYFDNMNWVADFWSATESSYTAIRRNIGYYDSVSLNEEYEEKYEWGYSVRCVKN